MTSEAQDIEHGASGNDTKGTHPQERLIVSDWGRRSYRDSLAVQHELVERRIAGEISDQLILVEHPHVFTYGRASNLQDIVPDSRTGASGRVELVPVERGGSVTYHGPGQIVAYPICDVRELTGDLHEFLRGLERVMIRTIAHWDIEGAHHPDHTGVWVGDRKIASVGVAVKKWVSYHGLALNVATKLEMFQAIRPCGLSPETMTTMESELERAPEIAEVKRRLVEEFAAEFYGGDR